jgi:hypothetical protein
MFLISHRRNRDKYAVPFAWGDSESHLTEGHQNKSKKNPFPKIEVPWLLAASLKSS